MVSLNMMIMEEEATWFLSRKLQCIYVHDNIVIA
jgi:hypothetical protein